MKIRFGGTSEYISGKYSGITSPRDHIVTCGYVWNELPKEVWSHMFIHTLDNIPKNWYMQLELRQETVDWEELTKNLITTFNFEDEDVMVETAL